MRTACDCQRVVALLTPEECRERASCTVLASCGRLLENGRRAGRELVACRTQVLRGEGRGRGVTAIDAHLRGAWDLADATVHCVNLDEDDAKAFLKKVGCDIGE